MTDAGSNGCIDPDVTFLIPRGLKRLLAPGIDARALKKGRRPLVRACPDFTERESHLVSSVGAAVARHFVKEE